MYNEEQKLRYMRENETRNVNITKTGTIVFNRIAREEKRLGKDCCNFSMYEILSFYRSTMTTSYASLQNMNSQYSLYTAWCVENHLVKDGINHYPEIGKENILDCLDSAIARNKLVTRESLIETFRTEIVNPSDQFLLLGIYEGIQGQKLCEFYGLNMSCFDGNIVHLNTGRELELSPKLVAIAEESSVTYDKTPYNHLKGKKDKIMYKADDINIIKRPYNAKDIDSIDRFRRRLENAIVACSELTQIKFTTKSLKESGRIEMIKAFMEEDKSKDWRETYIKHKDILDYRYGKASHKLADYEAAYGEFLT